MRVAAILSLAVTVGASAACREASASRGTPAEGDSKSRRADALRRAQVWKPPAVPVARVDLTANPDGPDWLAPDRDVPCQFKVSVVGGATPKFECALPDGQEAKVRYGDDNPEIAAEIAATRLMSALGFPTDRLFAVRSVKCAGCPRYPFMALRCYRRLHSEWACMPFRSDTAVRAFAPVVVELRHPGVKIESFPDEGWSWYELDQIDPEAGAPREHLDALRLMAVFLAHWDNKGANQRLVCDAPTVAGTGACPRPLAIVQDLGGSFGPFKIDLATWSAQTVWSDPRTCAVSMEHLPFGGATFPARRIGEGGRRMAADLLSQLSRAQVRDLFAAAGFRNVDGWVAAFLSRVEQIREAGPCPES